MRGSILLVISVLMVYGYCVSFKFLTWDDNFNIYANPPLLAGAVRYFWTSFYYNLYIPLAYTVWCLLAFGTQRPDPLPYHLVNLLLHALNTVEVFLILKLLLERSGKRPTELGREQVRYDTAAWIGAFLFAIHPVQVETVAWASGLRDLLSASFGLGATSICLKYSPKILSRNCLAAVLLIFGILAKPSIGPLPIAWLMWDILLFQREWKTSLQRFLITLLPALPFVQLSRLAQSSELFTHWVAPWYLRPIIALDTLGFYLIKLFLPLHLAVDYGRSAEWVITQFSFIPTILLVLIVVGGAYFFRKRIGWIPITGFLFSIILLIPVSGILPFAFQANSTVADHYLYIPLLGISLAFSYLLLKVPLKATLTLGITGCLLFFFVLRTELRLPTWENEKTFYTQWVRDNPESHMGYSGLAAVAFMAGDLESSERLYRETLKLVPYDPVAVANIGEIYVRRQQYARALEEVTPYLKDPEFQKWNRTRDHHMSFVYRAAGFGYQGVGLVEEAYKYFCQSIRLSTYSASLMAHAGGVAAQVAAEGKSCHAVPDFVVHK